MDTGVSLDPEHLFLWDQTQGLVAGYQFQERAAGGGGLRGSDLGGAAVTPQGLRGNIQ